MAYNSVLKELGLPSSSNPGPSSSSVWCSHGCLDDDDHQGAGCINNKTGLPYPYNDTAANILYRVTRSSGIVVHTNDKGEIFSLEQHDKSRYPIGLIVAAELLQKLSKDKAAAIAAGAAAPSPMIDPEGLAKSCVMMGTDLMRQASSNYDKNDIKFQVAKRLAEVILVMEEDTVWMDIDRDWPVYEVGKIMRKFSRVVINLDCPRNIIQFFHVRNPCSCLNAVKEQHKKRMGVCRYADCQKYSLDSKLLTCAGCSVFKYCTRSCQVADWSTHKVLCRALTKRPKNSLKAASDIAKLMCVPC